MAPLEELERAFERCGRDRRFRGRARPSSSRPTPAGRLRSPSRERLTRARGRRAHRAQARRPSPHRRAQAQQLARPGAPRPPDGEDPHRGRDRRRAARRRDRGGRGREARPPVPRLHGRRGHGAAGAERLAHAAPRRRGRRRGLRLADPEGRDQRGDARLDGERRARRTTFSAPRSARTPTRRWCANSSPSSAARRARSSRRLAGRDPRAVVACVGGGSNAIGLFSAYLSTPRRALRRRGGRPRAGARETTRRASPAGRVGVLHGTRTMLLQDDAGQVLPTHSVSAGLDYPAVGPEHARLADAGPGRVHAASRDDEALDAFERCPATEGILPALESAHAIALALEARAEVAAQTAGSS